MNTQEIKAKYAELAELDKQRTQGEWELGHGAIENAKLGEAPKTILYKNQHNCYRKIAECRTGDNAAFIAQAPAMFKMIGELLAENERLQGAWDIVADLKEKNQVLENSNAALKKYETSYSGTAYFELKE